MGEYLYAEYLVEHGDEKAAHDAHELFSIFFIQYHGFMKEIWKEWVTKDAESLLRIALQNADETETNEAEDIAFSVGQMLDYSKTSWLKIEGGKISKRLFKEAMEIVLNKRIAS